ncbi:hydroxymethylglutaryl-CoA synthase [Candidatus Peribacteria bacterium]|nr:hydroxymethylglutaryl-CoA synthase [Candidatus Peribacteria bacterium]
MSKSAIIGFGRYLPKYRITTAAIAEHHGQDAKGIVAGLGISEKTVPGREEDSYTMAFEAARQAIEVAEIQSSEISAIFVGSESHPYAVKPTSSMLASSLELHPFCHCADLEFACKAGTAGMQMVDSFIRSGQVNYGLAIGTDTAQGRPGDALEYTAAAGAAAFVLGSEKAKDALCRMETTLSFTTDTADFWRPAGEKYPHHAGRFTGEPAYVRHVQEVTKGILAIAKLKPADIDHVVFHMPNAKFPKAIAKKLGFTEEQMELGFIVKDIGNTYAACSPLGLTYVLEEAKKGETILLVSYGSGSGSDAFVMTMLRDGIQLPRDDRQPEYLTYDRYLEHSHALS